MPTLRFALLLALAFTTAAGAAPPAPGAAASATTREAWAIATVDNGHGTVICRYIETLGPKAAERSEQPDRVTLTWHYDADANNGMPTDADKAGMDELEDALAPAVESGGFSNLALVTTGDGVRAWVYYARSGDEFLARMKKALRDHPAFPVKTDVGADPGWTAFEAFRSQIAR
jgi:hypothetical protein